MRNLPWLTSVEHARRVIDYRRYHRYTDMWMPKDLMQGDIVRADLPTDINNDGNYEICPRNCLVVGIDVDRETQDVAALRLVRFSYHVLDCDHGRELLLDPRDPDLRTKLVGFRDQVVLRTGRVEIVPVASEFFGFYMDRIGRMDPSLFPQVCDSMRDNFAVDTRYRKIHIHGEGLGDTVLLPAADPQSCRKYTQFPMPYAIGTPLEKLETPDTFLQAMASRRLSMDIERVMQMDTDRRQRAGLYQKKDETRKALQSIIAAVRRTGKHALRGAALAQKIEDTAARLVAAEKALNEDFAASPGATGHRLSDIPDYRTLLRAHFGLTDTPAQTTLARVFAQAIDPQSLADLQTLGVGGLLREPRINLPQHLWRGRYLMMRIADLANPENMGDAYRPCAIWKAYARPNEDGDPVLAGFELHPCTRSAAGSSRYKMKVRPLDTVDPRASFLLADMVVRAPLDALYFQPHQREDFYYELLPHMVRELEVKRGLAAEHPRGITTYGLKSVPDDWVELALPGAPEEKLRTQLSGWKKARFMPANGPAPRPRALRA